MEPTLLKSAYLDYLRRHGHAPKTVFAFADAQGITEGEFYRHYASFAVIDRETWADFGREARDQAAQEPAWQGYGAREKLLAFYYTLLEILKNNRSFVLLTLGRSQRRQPALVPKVLNQFESEFKGFVQELLHEGRATGEVASRPFLQDGYGRIFLRQLQFILLFFVRDESANFERTDAAVEKAVTLSFDLVGRNTFDSALDFGRFLLHKHS
ncbi:TetR/AcrR family transcriptional regulator [Hymenobacter sp. HMF4947]|uniref:TetR/AcrR family transcriptional regulator n=1 Tax=Hymenobacter ginkgonis TaxID=2682976 RepID=A0A7K1TA46_9BACT|nr:TetR family transcriptional regulator C-terminal domain-containing protein [Hymenobacter ginkgonis]MVN75286.1 TetR/AcrR family transcriptional regulator [Hymenobacter ginkgonis]